MYFTHVKRQKRIGDDVGDVRYVIQTKNKKSFCENDPLIRFIHLIMQKYDSALKCILIITLKVF
jgi:hypothetical protein